MDYHIRPQDLCLHDWYAPQCQTDVNDSGVMYLYCSKCASVIKTEL